MPLLVVCIVLDTFKWVDLKAFPKFHICPMNYFGAIFEHSIFLLHCNWLFEAFNQIRCLIDWWNVFVGLLNFFRARNEWWNRFLIYGLLGRYNCRFDFLLLWKECTLLAIWKKTWIFLRSKWFLDKPFC